MHLSTCKLSLPALPSYILYTRTPSPFFPRPPSLPPFISRHRHRRRSAQKRLQLSLPSMQRTFTPRMQQSWLPRRWSGTPTQTNGAVGMQSGTLCFTSSCETGSATATTTAPRHAAQCTATVHAGMYRGWRARCRRALRLAR